MEELLRLVWPPAKEPELAARKGLYGFGGQVLVGRRTQSEFLPFGNQQSAQRQEEDIIRKQKENPKKVEEEQIKLPEPPPAEKKRRTDEAVAEEVQKERRSRSKLLRTIL